MTSFVCCICYKSFDNRKSFSNHMRKCDNDDEEGGDGVDSNSCDVYNNNDDNADAVDNVDAVDNADNANIDNANDADYLENHEVDDICYNDCNSANVAESYDNIELLLDIDLESESESEESDNISHESDTSIMLVNEEMEIEIMNDISKNSLMKYKESKITDQSNLSSNMIAAIELLSLLRASGASLNLYEKIVFWVENRFSNVLLESLPTREKVIKVMEKRHHLKCISPMKKKVTLPSINLPIEIPVNPLLGCIYSLLADSNLMSSENLIFPDTTNPASIPEFENKYSEINTGLSYLSFQKRIKHFGNAVQIPLIFFIDGTAIDRACRHCQTPVMFTLGIFKQCLRNRSSAWRNLGFVKSNIKQQYSAKEIKRASRDQVKYPKNHNCYVPDNHNDFHKQLECIMNDLLRLQAQRRGIKWTFTIDGKTITKEFRLFFPVLFFTGDTMEHNKLCSLRGGSKGKFPCRLCWTKRMNLDNPATISLSKMKNSESIKHLIITNPSLLKSMGYYACSHNILYKLQYCDPGGLNYSLPPDILHAVLLGYVTRLINGFARLKKIGNESMYVFSDSYKSDIELDLLAVGLALSKQSDIDLPKTHFPSGYLPNPKKTEDNSSGKKNAHELRGVLLTILCFLLLYGQFQKLEERIGDDRLGGYVKIMELTLLLEAWLNKDEFTEAELKLFDEFLPYYIHTYTSTVNRTDGEGMKLIKIHLLHHFTTMIRLFGCCKNFDTFIPEKNHKTKVKEHARRTRYQSIDFEYRTAKKDYEDCVLHAAEQEVKLCSSVISKFIGIHQQTTVDSTFDILKKMRCGVSFRIDSNDAGFLLGKGKRPIQWNSKFFKQNQLKQFVQQYELSGIFGQTQFNTVLKQEIVKIHGDPTINHHDWVLVSHDGKRYLCHVVCFVDVCEVKREAIFQVGNLDKPGLYGICHYVNQDVFTNTAPTDSMYGDGNYTSYRTDENCSLIRGWAKFTEQINGPRMPRNLPVPSLAMFSVQNIISTCSGIEDCQNPIPHSYIFLPPRHEWPKLFHLRMIELMEKEGHNLPEDEDQSQDDHVESDADEDGDEDGDEDDEDGDEDD